MEDFSVVVITLNEEKTLSRLLRSLKGVKDIVIMDSGSTDKTVEIAKEAGARVIETGEKFRYHPSEEEVEEWKDKFGFDSDFKVDKGYFHYADARNHAVTFAENDWCFMPDADEEVRWDIDKVRQEIQDTDQLVYSFVFQHKADGTPALQFSHSKFYRKSKFKWVKWVHEVLSPIAGQNPRQPKWTDAINHHHYQNQEQNRGHYLPGLELSVLREPDDDRNAFYLAREFLYNRRYDTAIKMFDHYLSLNGWVPERGQAYIYLGDCYRYKGDNEKAVENYHKAMITDDTRREAFWELGSLMEEMKKLNSAKVYYRAALEIPYNPNYYFNDMVLYQDRIHDKLALVYSQTGDEEKAYDQWRLALKQNPNDDRLLSNFKWFFRNDMPLISIVVPTLWRHSELGRLLESIEKNTVYPNYEIVLVFDGDKEGYEIFKKRNKLRCFLNKERMGAVRSFNRGVGEARGDFVAYVANDCEVEKGWLVQAYICWKDNFRNRGLVVLNDGYWEGQMANHFLASKNIRDTLGSEIWHSGYFHVGCDNELSFRLKKEDLIVYCPEAKIVHHHYCTNTKGTEPAKKDKVYELMEEHITEDRRLLFERQKKLGPKIAIYCSTYNEGHIIGEFVKENLKFSVVDSIWISDNNSTDDTRRVAREAGAMVQNSHLVHNWNKKENYSEHDAKQAALDFAHQSDCEWFMYLDADEFIENAGEWKLVILINNIFVQGWRMAIPTFWLGRTHYRTDGDFGACYLTKPYPFKLFRRDLGVTMSKTTGGQHSHPEWQPPAQIEDCDLRIKHYAFDTKEIALKKYERYRKVDPESVMSLRVPNYEHLHPDYAGVVLEEWKEVEQ